MRNEILKTIRKYKMIKEGEHIVLGLSGGPDSVCLFNVLLWIRDNPHVLLEKEKACDVKNDKRQREYKPINLYAVHVNHMFRGDSAYADAVYVKELCEKFNVSVKIEEIDCNALCDKYGISPEEAGRKARYEAFEKMQRELVDKGIEKSSIKIALAHNADDRAETVLFRIMRGSGMTGISSISYLRNIGEMTVIRPLLDVYKVDISSYCDGQKLNPRFDETNDKPMYSRNRIRLELIPFLESYNGRIKEALNHLAQAALEDREYLEECSKEAFCSARLEKKENGHGFYFSLKALLAQSIAIRRRVFARAFSLTGGLSDITFDHYLMCDNVLKSDNPSSVIYLPNNIEVRREYEEIFIGVKREDEGCKWKLNVFTEENRRGKGESLREQLEKYKSDKSHYAFFDRDKIAALMGTEDFTNLINIRCREPGDYIFISGGGRKKLKNLYIDKKVPKYLREKLPVAAIGRMVLVAGLSDNEYRHSHGLGVDEHTKNAIVVEIIRVV